MGEYDTWQRSEISKDQSCNHSKSALCLLEGHYEEYLAAEPVKHFNTNILSVKPQVKTEIKNIITE